MNAVQRASAAAATDEPRTVLVARSIVKSFPGVLALDNVDFDVRAGEVTALLGENGAGKSTLIKMMAGFYAPDRGEITVDGQTLHADPAEAHRVGVATIHQDAHLVPAMTVAENIMLGRWPTRYGMVSVERQRQRALEALARVAPHLNPNTLAGRLSPADQQLVEIARAISEDSKVLVMDEPTTSLSPPEIDRLFSVVDELRAKDLGIVFVSHWLEEVFTIADRVTVLRDGKLIGTRPISELDHDEVIRMMVGREVRETVVETRPIGDVVLSVKNLNRENMLSDISFEVAAGEIVGMSGLVGAGRSELAAAIFGIDDYDSGSVEVAGVRVRSNDPAAAIEAGIGLVPEDRRQQALISLLSVRMNITLSFLDHVKRWGLLSPALEEEIADREIRALAVKTPSSKTRVSSLSGGNQQKVVLARWLTRNPKVLILDEPTKGIDVGAKSEISELILRLARSGMGILLISSELPEILSLSDRVLVMRSGRITASMPREQATGETIMSAATMG
ncbi:sugar ABC transporter ATP-binding protein [Nitratireductor kimnyeongensis]|uniref:Sugar ABC transporter ATP-binding protein n=1 Tax=Nitratireductor kimnyeongensis TaxID=430679 RepID=A0ABW0TBK6_9HYPH|nr:sugar ABC transporter ATP-binding protein [Nitratireductor kimnyeongensis]QZZ36965.1 sugar ABC transporter ATP-binding protein [Nitratireductor kimnyeongensis]